MISDALADADSDIRKNYLADPAYDRDRAEILRVLAEMQALREKLDRGS